MKEVLLIAFISILIQSSSGCIKDNGCQNKTVQSEQTTIQTYANINGINAVAHSSGIYYEIISPGSGPTPNLDSKIFVTYTGKLITGTTFDSGTTPTGGWALRDLIPGWQIGLPLIKKGGSIKLIIPSSLCYGCGGKGIIPGNAILFFEITLNDVQ